MNHEILAWKPFIFQVPNPPWIAAGAPIIQLRWFGIVQLWRGHSLPGKSAVGLGVWILCHLNMDVWVEH